MNQPPARLHSDPDLASLIEAVLDGQADGSQFAELERRLSSDASARDVYATYVNVHCELLARFAVEGDIVGLEAEMEREFREGELADFRRTIAAESLPRQSRRSISALMAMAAICALIAIGIFAWRQRTLEEAPSTPALAHVRDLEGKVIVIGSTGAAAARTGDALRPGDRLRTDQKDARAVLEYADGTTVEVHFDSAVQAPAGGDVRLRLLSGSIAVHAAPQPADRPLILATDHARYVVLGTRFRLYRDESATRLELNEGKVRLERQAGDRVVETVQVEAGTAAVVSAEAAPVEVLPLAAGRARLHARLKAAGQDVVLSPSGDQILLNDGSRGLTICRSDDFEVQCQLQRDAAPGCGLAFDQDGQSAARLSHDHVLLWKPHGAESQAVRIPLPRRVVRSRALSPNGRFVAESSDEGIELSAIDYAAGRLKSLAVLPNRDGKSGKAWSMAFSQDGGLLAAGFWDGMLRVYQPNAGQAANPSCEVVHEYMLAGTILPVAIAADGRYLAAFTNEAGLQLIDTAAGERHDLWSSAGARVLSLRFTPDGRWLMAGCSDRTARLWSTLDGRPLLVIETEHAPQGMASLPQRRMLITAGDSVKLWEYELP